MTLDNEKCVKIVTPVGMLGYGYDVKQVYRALDLGATAIIMDSGSTDDGPHKLGLGSMTMPLNSYLKDLKPVVDATWHRKVKLLIASAGGDGSNQHVDDLVKVIQEYIVEKGYQLKVVKIYSEIEKKDILNAIQEGNISPCGPVPELTPKDVDAATRVVGQMGMEPFVKVIEEIPDFDIIVAGRSYDPSPYIAYCFSQGITNLGTLFHMGKVMECGGLCLVPKTKTALATVWQDKFEISPLIEGVVCTCSSLAAHTLYEKSRPDLLVGPGGTLDLRHSKYEQSGISAIASGAKFIPSNPYTIKLEGAKISGYRCSVFGSISDPILVAQIDPYTEMIKEYLRAYFVGDFKINVYIYGRTPFISNDSGVSSDIAVLTDIIAESQDLADRVAAAARVAWIHGPYPMQKATAGNFAMPLVPLEIPLGPFCEFNVYHLMNVSDPVKHFPIEYQVYGPGTSFRDPLFKPVLTASNTADQNLSSRIPKIELPSAISHPKDPSKVYLHTLAKIIRSKNSGPFEYTFDIIFKDLETFHLVKNSGELSVSRLAAVYGRSKEQISVCMFFEQAHAFKLTIPREIPSGSFGDGDLYGCQQHVPLMFLELSKSNLNL